MHSVHTERQICKHLFYALGFHKKTYALVSSSSYEYLGFMYARTTLQTQISKGEMATTTMMEISRELFKMLEFARDHQQQTLLKIVQDNVGCEYFLKHGFQVAGDEVNKDDFKAFIPLSDYPDAEEYIKRVADDGESFSLLCNYPLINFSISSGTTAGKSKKFPCTLEYFQLFEKALAYMISITQREKDEAVSKGLIQVKEPRIMSLAVAGKQFTTNAGYTVGSVLTNFYRGDFFKKIYNNMGYCSPIEVVLSEDSPQALYCHLLCGLINASEVWSFDAGFSFNMDAAINVFRTKWQCLCEDIRKGILNDEVKDENLRKSIQGILRPDPQLADAIERECSKSEWRGILRRLWPNALFIQCRASGPTMKSYLSRINRFSDNLPIYGLSYGASEGGHLGICLDVQKSLNKEIQYTFLPNVAFYEFLPLKKFDTEHHETLGSNDFDYKDSNGRLETVEIDGVEVGEYYQPVVTTFQGLYRYQLPDIIKITGFHGESPTFEFVCRKNTILGVNTDKTDEGELESVIGRACEFLAKHGVTMVEYTSSVDMSCSPGHYVIFMELIMNNRVESLEDVMQECCNLVDSLFNHAYKKGRKAGKIGPLKMCVVERGTFQRLMEERMMRGASLSQYKPPRSIPLESTSGFLLSNSTVKFYTSSATMWSVYSDC